MDYKEVEFYEHQFEGWAEQRNWILSNCNIRNEIVFFLDADEYIEKDFISELKGILDSGADFDAIYVKLVLIFLGRRLKHAYGHPKILRLFKKDGLYFEGEGAREYAITKGHKYIKMKSLLYHQDHRDIDFWIQKHIKNALREAELILGKEKSCDISPNVLKIKIKLWIRRSIWNKLPLIIRPFIYFIFRYFFQLGLLDGKEGLIYCFLHALWYPMIISIKILERLKQDDV